MNFNVGDRVRCIKRYGPAKINDTGIIIQILTNYGTEIGVKFDKNIGGHDCDGSIEYGYGYYMPPNCLELQRPLTTDELFEELTRSLNGI